jgi:hypothetical protein
VARLKNAETCRISFGILESKHFAVPVIRVAVADFAPANRTEQAYVCAKKMPPKLGFCFYGASSKI